VPGDPGPKASKWCNSPGDGDRPTTSRGPVWPRRPGVDLILVGDSMANVVLGQETTLHITIDEMCHHVRAVAAAKPEAHVVADMPWLSYHVDSEKAFATPRSSFARVPTA